MKTVNLVCFGHLPGQPWPSGDVFHVEKTPRPVADLLSAKLPGAGAAAWLFWDPALGRPDPAAVQALLDQPGDVFHAGLLLGMGGLPEVIDYVKPTWMLNCDPPAETEATSWRISLRCCLVRAGALRQLGGALPEFETLEGAALEMGYRYIRQGAVARNTPALLETGTKRGEPARVPFSDQALFLRLHFNRFWNRYALWRAWRNRRVSFAGLLQEMRKTGPKPGSSRPVFSQAKDGDAQEQSGGRVSVLIPTLGRYPYLRTLLPQLRDQTIPPLEIIIVDQTEKTLREDLKASFPDLPLVVIEQDTRGQSTARNAGLQAARGDYILFIDDDDDVPPDLIQKHLESIQVERCEVSCGVAHEAGAGPLPVDFRYRRVSDVFPTNNSMVLRSALARSGLFDLAFDHGPRADLDIGMRLYLSGALMILNPRIDLLHHHAPDGGLRTYKARVVTYASSRRSVLTRPVPAATEFYLVRRYFSSNQRRESFLIRVLGTLAYHGSGLKKLAKLLVSLALLPDTLSKMRAAQKKAALLKTDFPTFAEPENR